MYWLSEEFLWRAIFEHVRHGLKGNFPNHELMNWNDRGMILATWYLSYRSQSAIIWKRVSVLPARNKRWQISKQSDGGSSIWCTGTGNDVASDICPSSGIVSWRQDRIYLYSHSLLQVQKVVDISECIRNATGYLHRVETNVNHSIYWAYEMKHDRLKLCQPKRSKIQFQ